MNVGTLTISLTARTASLAKAGAQVKLFEKGVIASVQRINASIASVGMAFSALTIPIAALAGGSVKLFSEFEFSLAKIEGLVGIAHDTTMQWGAEVLKLSKTIGKSATEMGDALYFVSSAGIRGANTMKVVQKAAQASAAGMGDTHVIANLLTSVMNAYGEANISAAESMDVLVTAVREGKVEAPDLITALGKVLPISSAMGASFNEVGAAIAAMTRTGTPARTAGMMVQRMLFSLQKPGNAAIKTLEGMGDSFDHLRNIVRTEKGGILKVLLQIKSLTDKFGEEKMAKIFPNIRAYLPALDLLGNNLEKNKGIWMSMLEPAGNFQKLIDATAGTFKYKFMVAVNAAREALIQIGHTFAKTLIPVINSFAEKMRELSKWWTGLPRDTQQLIVKITLLAGVIGPLLIVFSSLLSVVTTIVSVFVGFVGILGTVTGAVLGLAAAIYLVMQNTEEWDQWLSKKLNVGLIKGYQKEIKRTEDMFTEFRRAYQVTDDGKSDLIQNQIKSLSTQEQQLRELIADFNKIPVKNKDARDTAYFLIKNEEANIAHMRTLIINEALKNKEFLDKFSLTFGGMPARGGASLQILKDDISKEASIRQDLLLAQADMSRYDDITFGDALIHSLEKAGENMKPVVQKIKNMLKDMFNVDGKAAGSFPSIAKDIDYQKELRAKLRGIAAVGAEFMTKPELPMFGTNKVSGIDDSGVVNSKFKTFEGLSAKFVMDANKLRDASILIGKDFDYISKKLALYNEFVSATEGLTLYTPEQVAILKEMYAEIDRLTKAQRESKDAYIDWSNVLKNAFTGMQGVITNALNSTEGILQSFGKFFSDFIKGLVFKLIAATIAALALVAVISMIPGLGKLNGFKGVSAAMKEGKGFSAALGLMLGGTSKTGLANGGIIPAGYPNDSFDAKLTSNEAVIPLERLPQLLGIGRSDRNNKVEFIIEGRYLKGILADANAVSNAY